MSTILYGNESKDAKIPAEDRHSCLTTQSTQSTYALTRPPLVGSEGRPPISTIRDGGGIYFAKLNEKRLGNSAKWKSGSQNPCYRIEEIGSHERFADEIVRTKIFCLYGEFELRECGEHDDLRRKGNLFDKFQDIDTGYCW